MTDIIHIKPEENYGAQLYAFIKQDDLNKKGHAMIFGNGRSTVIDPAEFEQERLDSLVRAMTQSGHEVVYLGPAQNKYGSFHPKLGGPDNQYMGAWISDGAVQLKDLRSVNVMVVHQKHKL